MEKRGTYHHGDLRAAFIKAGEAVLAETSPSKFSLRQVARMVGVSPSAPAHHFGDTDGLLMAIAAEGFRALLASMELHNHEAGPDPRQAFIGSGVGYLKFATRSPAVFSLMFGPHFDSELTEELMVAGDAAFEHLAHLIEGLTGKSRDHDPEVMTIIMAVWSTVHGYANIVNSGSSGRMDQMSEDERVAFFKAVMERVRV